MILLLKLTLAPFLIACVTLAARRWGPRLGGMLASLPVVAGPALYFYAVERGPLFAASAAQGTLLGLAAVGAFCLAYALCAMRAHWSLSLLAGWLAFAATSLLLLKAPPGLFVDLGIALGGLLSALCLLPRSNPDLPARATGKPKWDLPLRM